MEDKPASLDRESDGYFSGLIHAKPGALYPFRIDGGERLYPDPASRFQPDGPHGPSEIVDPTAFQWTDSQWGGATIAGQVVYEMHVGTFTREGTWAAAARELDELARLGITMIELMPIADFHGKFGWGYDGVNLFAPTRLYGRPDDFRRFVNMAHAAGIAVILDVVYSHLGPVGNYRQSPRRPSPDRELRSRPDTALVCRTAARAARRSRLDVPLGQSQQSSPAVAMLSSPS